ncbi:MAG TPA: hypothetical protein VF710_21095 [Longimicrobium sp.]|jgi:hypothetical protein
MKSSKLNLSAFVALAAILTASPSFAQGKGHGHGNGKHDDDRPRQEARRDRDDDRYDRDRRDETRFERREGRAVPRGWCQGRGNPHNTARNCGYRGDLDRVWRDRSGVLRDRNGRVILSDGRVYDDRNRTNGSYGTNGTNGSYGSSNNGSYEARHAEFHRWHDQQCRDRAAQAGGISGRIRVAAACKAEHDQWHNQQGIRH